MIFTPEQLQPQEDSPTNDEKFWRGEQSPVPSEEQSAFEDFLRGTGSAAKRAYARDELVLGQTNPPAKVFDGTHQVRGVSPFFTSGVWSDNQEGPRARHLRSKMQTIANASRSSPAIVPGAPEASAVLAEAAELAPPSAGGGLERAGSTAFDSSASPFFPQNYQHQQAQPDEFFPDRQDIDSGSGSGSAAIHPNFMLPHPAAATSSYAHEVTDVEQQQQHMYDAYHAQGDAYSWMHHVHAHGVAHPPTSHGHSNQ